MKNPIIIEIEGDPVSKQSFKIAMRGRYAIKYKDEKVQDQEDKIRSIAKTVMQDTIFYAPVDMRVVVFRSIPKTLYNSKKKLALCLSGRLLPDVRPDFDNITKLLADAIETEIYKNDGQVCKYIFEKYYSLKPRTIIMVEEIDLTIDRGSEECRIEKVKQQKLNFIEDIV